MPRGGGKMGRAAFFGIVWASQLLLLSAARRATSPRIVTSPRGEARFRFDTQDNHVALYHEEGTSSVFVGAVNSLYYYDFETSTKRTEPFPANETESNCEHPKNYLTLLEKWEGKMLICGSNACHPTCWNWVDHKEESGMDPRGLAPFSPDSNALVLIDGKDIYSTIKKQWYNGRIPRFRRIQGSTELYTSDTVMENPQFVKAVAVKQDHAYNDKIYYFFREDNSDWLKNAAAPKTVSRVAQLCKGDKGGSSSLSATKWTTFLKASLFCADSNTDRHFNRLQDIFIVKSDAWSETKVYGLFTNEWDYSAVCVYSVGEIAKVFQTSPLKGYSEKLPTVRPGQCLEHQLTPQETFKVADSHPEVEHPVKHQAILFHSKHRYQKVGVHEVEAADGIPYNVLYLATDQGTIHKVVVLKDGPMNILEIQPFQRPAVIKTMILDNAKRELYVASTSEVVRLPMATCGVYKDNCESCVMARDPYCGWRNGKCTSVYAEDQLRNGTLLQALSHDVSPDVCASSNDSKAKEDLWKSVLVVPLSRYYLNCSVESHHARYTWVHNNQSIFHCGASPHPCVYFIDSMTENLYGYYSCISQESWLKQTLVSRRLVKPESETSRHFNLPLNGWATAVSSSFWLSLLHMGAVFLLIL